MAQPPLTWKENLQVIIIALLLMFIVYNFSSLSPDLGSDYRPSTSTLPKWSTEPFK